MNFRFSVMVLIFDYAPSISKARSLSKFGSRLARNRLLRSALSLIAAGQLAEVSRLRLASYLVGYFDRWVRFIRPPSDFAKRSHPMSSGHALTQINDKFSDVPDFYVYPMPKLVL
jgi:hypothetical protein